MTAPSGLTSVTSTGRAPIEVTGGLVFRPNSTVRVKLTAAQLAAVRKHKRLHLQPATEQRAATDNPAAPTGGSEGS